MVMTAFLQPEPVRHLSGLIDRASKVTVAAHARPDGDALGSCAALAEYLTTSRGKDTAAILPDTPPRNLRFLLPDGIPFLFHDAEPENALRRIRESDLVILLDCSGFSRTEGLEVPFRESGAGKVLIDHHLNPETEDFSLVFSTPGISSASELLYWILLEMPGMDGNPRRLPPRCAAALLSGMTTDTNNFANSVFPSTLRMASQLLEAGVDRDAILTELYQRSRENRVRAMGYLQNEGLHITPEGVAYMIATREIQDRFGLEEGETEGLVNIPLSIEQVRMSILLKEGDGQYRVSLRSKKGISAQRCAAAWFNGGGHENASGGKLLWPRDIARKEDAAAYLEMVSKEFMK
ncbi:MAG: bifunctional oligoribonuclease/PAP phosphatase NrnA [Bacteroidales bacterium]|nr:bifunctional oligoribonuclease/PAP phosphatase NrnA [Bacteroidales bacterium]